MPIDLTLAELNALIGALLETAAEMDDDGREGAFAVSPLGGVYRKLIAARNAARGR